MPLTVIPHKNASATIEGMKAEGEEAFTVIGTEDPNAAIAAAAAYAPGVLAVGTGIGWLSKWKYQLVEGLANVMIVTAMYSAEDDQKDGHGDKGKPPPAVGEWEFQGSVISRQLKLQFAKETIKRASRDGGMSTLNTLSNSIGWDGKKINGIEWPSGHCKITIKSYFHSHALTVDLMDEYNAWIGYVNEDDDWLGVYQHGEARFLGSNLDQVIPYAAAWPSKPVAVQFEFDISKSGEIEVPGVYWEDTAGPNTFKEGWDMLDVYSRIKHSDEGIPIPVPELANIRRVANRTSFAEAFAWNPSNRRGAGVPLPP